MANRLRLATMDDTCDQMCPAERIPFVVGLGAIVCNRSCRTWRMSSVVGRSGIGIRFVCD